MGMMNLIAIFVLVLILRGLEKDKKEHEKPDIEMRERTNWDKLLFIYLRFIYFTEIYEESYFPKQS